MDKAVEVYFRFLGERSITVEPIIFKLSFLGFDFDLRWYTVLIATGFLLAVLLGGRQVWKGFLQSKTLQKYSLPNWHSDLDGILDVLIGGTVGGVIGARLYYVIFQWQYFRGDLARILNYKEGGLAIYGGLIGGILCGMIICRLRGVSIKKLLDLCGMCFLIGQGFGRWGNFANQEAFGTNTELPWGMRSEKTIQYLTLYPQDGVDPNGFVHPTFLYESLWCLLGFVLLYLIFRKAYHFNGQIFLCYGIWYGAARFILEGMRTDSLMLGSLRISQLLSAVFVVVSAVLLLCGLAKHKSKIPLFSAKESAEDSLTISP